MSKTEWIAMACAVLAAPACSGGGGGTTSGTGLVVTGSGTSSPTASGGSSTGANDTSSSGNGPGATATGSSGGNGASSGTAAGGTTGGTTGGIIGPDFALTASPNTLTLPAGGQGTVQVNIQRDAGTAFDTDSLIFAIASDAGIVGTFDPTPASGDATALTLNVGPTVPTGDYAVLINASSSTNPQSAHDALLTLTVSTQVLATLLVDNDASSNNADGGGEVSPSDAFFAQQLQAAGILYDNYVITSTGTDAFDSSVLQNYSTVVWYTGANNLNTGNGCLSSAQEQFLEDWLNQGGKTLLMFSPYLVQDLDPFAFWQDQPSDNFLSLYVGAAGCDVNPQGNFDGMSFVATGVDGTPFGTPDGGGDDAGPATFDISPSPIADTAAVINVGDGGSVSLVTVEADELHIGQPQAWPTTVMNTKAGSAGTSTVVYVAMPIEDIPTSDAGGSFFSLVQQALP